MHRFCAAKGTSSKSFAVLDSLGSTAYAGRMNDTPDPNGPGRKRRFWRPSSASEWVELAIYVFFALIALLAGVGWLVARL
jgi:hypothetical protein